MYQRHDERGYLSTVFVQKVKEFIDFATGQETYHRTTKINCPCAKCWNVPYLDVNTVKFHLYRWGFRPNYYEGVCHGEAFGDVSHPGSSSNVRDGENLMRDMVLDAYGPMASLMADEGMNDGKEEPFLDAKRFIQLVQAAEKPLYKGSDMSLLKVVARLTSLKC